MTSSAEEFDHIINVARKQSDVISKHAEDEAQFIRSKTQENISTLWTLTHDEVERLTREIRDEASQITKIAADQASVITDQANDSAQRMLVFIQRLLANATGMSSAMIEKLRHIDTDISKMIEESKTKALADRESILDIAKNEAMHQLESMQSWAEEVHHEAIAYGQNLVQAAQDNADKIRAKALFEADRLISEANKESLRRLDEVKTFSESIRIYSTGQVKTELEMSESEARLVLQGAYDQMRTILEDARNSGTLIHERASDRLASAMSEALDIVDNARQNGVIIEEKASAELDAARQRADRLILDAKEHAQTIINEAEGLVASMMDRAEDDTRSIRQEAETVSESLRQQAIDYHDLLVQTAEKESEGIMAEAEQLESEILGQARAAADSMGETTETQENINILMSDATQKADRLIERAEIRAAEIIEKASEEYQQMKASTDNANMIASEKSQDSDAANLLILDATQKATRLIEQAETRVAEMIENAQLEADSILSNTNEKAFEILEKAQLDLDQNESFESEQTKALAIRAEADLVREASLLMGETREKSARIQAQADLNRLKAGKAISNDQSKFEIIDQAKLDAEEIIANATQKADYIRTLAESDALEVKESAARYQQAIVQKKTYEAEEIRAKAIVEAKSFMDEVRAHSKQEWNNTLREAYKIAEKKDSILKEYTQFEQEVRSKISASQAKLEQIEQHIRNGQEEEARIKARVEILLEPLTQRKEPKDRMNENIDVLHMNKNGLFISNPKANKSVTSTVDHKQQSIYAS